MRKLIILLVALCSMQRVAAQQWEDVWPLSMSPVEGLENINIQASKVQKVLDDIWIIGTFLGKMTYGDAFLTSNGEGIFVLRIDENGNLISLKGSSSGLASLSSVQTCIDKYSNLYAAFVLKPGDETDWGYKNESKDYVGVVVKFDPDFNKIWIKEVMNITPNNHTSAGNFTSIYVGDDENVYLASKSGAYSEGALPGKPVSSGKISLPKEEDIIPCGMSYNYFKSYLLNRDTLTKYNKNNKLDSWISNVNILYKNYNDWIDNNYDKFQSTSIKVGDSTYFVLMEYVFVLMCVDAANGNLQWSNGFTSLMDVKCNSSNNITHLLPRQSVTTTIEIRDMLYFDNRLFVAGSHSGIIIDGKKYKSLCAYAAAGFIGYSGSSSAKRTSDLLLMSVDARNGKAEWVQSGGGRGTDQYMRIIRKDNYLFVLGDVQPGDSSVVLGDGTGTAAKDGIMVDSVASMHHDVIESHVTRKQSSRMAVNNANGMLYAKYNTEGRLIKKHYLPNGSTPVAHDLRDSILAVASRIETMNYARTVVINADTIEIPAKHGAMVIGVYDNEANPIETLHILDDSLTTKGTMRIYLNDNGKLFIAGRFRSKSIDVGGKVIENQNFSNNNKTNTFSGYLAKAGLEFQPAFTTVEHVLCYGDSTGKLKVEPFFVKDKSACTYEWKKVGDDGFQFKHTAPGLKDVDYSAVYELPAGEYKVTVRDGHLERTLVQQIKQPDRIVINATVKDNEGCANNGEIELDVTGGMGSYTYFWSVTSGNNGKLQASEVTTRHITKLRKGEYVLRVSDAKYQLCSRDTTIEIKGEPIPIVGLDLVNANYNNTTQKGTITIPQISGGIGNLNLELIFPSGTSIPIIPESVKEVNETGIYAISVCDATGCQETKPIALIDNASFYAKVNSKKHVSCFGRGDGEIEFVESGATNVSRNWYRDGISIDEPNLINGVFVGLEPGIYRIDFSTSNGNFTLTDTIKEPQKLEVTAVVKDITCYEEKNGQIAIDVKGGTYPYTYKWTSQDDKDCLGQQDVSQTIKQLTASTSVVGNDKILRKGIYHVDVIDNNKCLASLDTAINMPHDITAYIDITHLSCYGKEDGQMKLPYDSIRGGNGGYYHIWSNTLMAPEIHGLRATTYGVTIYDQKGCSKEFGNRSVKQPVGISLSSEITSPPCAENPDGKIVVSNVEGYTYKWKSTHDISGRDEKAQLEGIPAGIYTLTVFDAKGCDHTEVFDVKALNQAPNVGLTLSDMVICSGNNVELWAESNGSASYSYYINDSLLFANILDDNIALTMNKAGNFTMTVTDRNTDGCLGKASVPITVKTTPSARIDADSALAWCKGTTIKLNLSAVEQDNTNIEWTWGENEKSTNRTIEANAVGTYTLRTERDGCSSTNSVQVVEFDKEDIHLAVLPSNPSLGFQPSDTLWCYGLGHVATLSASRHDASKYIWLRDEDTLILGNGKKLISPELITNIPGTYQIKAVFGGCNTITNKVTIGPRPRINLNLVKDTTITAGNPFVLDLGEDAAIKGYEWREKNSGSILSTNHYMEIDTRYAQDGDVRDFVVTVVDTNECPAQAPTRVRIYRAPVQTTGLTDVSVEPLTLYPNPTHSGFYVEAPASNRVIRVYSASGQLMLEQPIEGKTWVSTTHLAAGFYLVHTETAAAKLVVE